MTDLKYLVVYSKNERKIIYIEPNNLKLGDYIGYIRKIYDNKLIKLFEGHIPFYYKIEGFFGTFLNDVITVLKLLNKKVKYYLDLQLDPEIAPLTKNGLVFSFEKLHKDKKVTYEIHLVFSRIIKLNIITEDFVNFEIKNINKEVTFKDLCKIKLDKLDIVDKLLGD